MKEFFKKIIIQILRIEAWVILKKNKPKIIAITGTVGKTTTKDILYAGLEDLFFVRKTPKGYNSDIGVLLSVLGLKTGSVSFFIWVKNIWKGFVNIFKMKYPEILILEVGASYPGEIKKNAKLLKPDIVVLTRLPKIMAHMEFFKNRQQFVDEKLSLVSFAKRNAIIVYNADDETLVKELREEKCNFKTKIGFGKNSDFWFKEILIKEDEKKHPIGFEFILNSGQNFFLKGVLGEHFGYSLSSLFAISDILNLDNKKIVKSLQKNFKPAPGRMRIFEGVSESVIIDDSYNALPESVKNGAKILSQIKTNGRKIYVLGKLAELGNWSEKSYKQAIEYIKSVADILILVNDEGLGEKNINNNDFKEVYFFNDVNNDFLINTEKAGKFLKKILKKGDVVIFKGSRHSTGFEAAIQYLLKNERDKKQLVQDYL